METKTKTYMVRFKQKDEKVTIRNLYVDAINEEMAINKVNRWNNFNITIVECYETKDFERVKGD